MKPTDIFEIAGAIVLSAGGVGAVLFGLSSWLGKVWASRILASEKAQYAEQLSRLQGELEATNRRLQAELDKTIHVHRIQFETEFKALVDVWRTASAVRSAITGLRPQTGLSEDDPETAFITRFNDFCMKLNQFKSAVDDHSPFYTAEIRASADQLIRTAIHEEVACQVKGPRDGEWFRDGRASVAAYIAGCHALSEAIRQRITQLSVRV